MLCSLIHPPFFRNSRTHQTRLIGQSGVVDVDVDVDVVVVVVVVVAAVLVDTLNWLLVISYICFVFVVDCCCYFKRLFY